MINSQLKRGKNCQRVINFKGIFFSDSRIQFRWQEWFFPFLKWNIKPPLIEFIFESSSGSIAQRTTERILFLALVPGTGRVDLKPTHYTECYYCQTLIHNCKKVGDGIYSLWNQCIHYHNSYKECFLQARNEICPSGGFASGFLERSPPTGAFHPGLPDGHRP